MKETVAQTFLINTTFKKIALISAFCALLGFAQTTRGHGLSVDSVHAEKQQKQDVTFTGRLQSLGYFSFGGRLVSDNPSLDFYLSYKRQTWGASFFKVFDLYDHHTPNNFSMALIYKNFQLGNRLTITPYVGIVLEQLEGIADHDSDFTGLLNTQFRISNTITLEHTGLLSNLVMERELQDWVNRFKIIYHKNQYTVTWLGWHNNNVFDETNYYSTGLSAFYNNVKLSESVSLNSGITTHSMIFSSDEERNPKKHGILFTLAFVFDQPDQ